jgi:hypothetical protein
MSSSFRVVRSVVDWPNLSENITLYIALPFIEFWLPAAMLSIEELKG